MQLKLAFLVCLVCAALTLSGCDGQNAQKSGQAPTPEVGVVTLRAAPVALRTELSGRTVPFAIAEVRPQVNGLIQQRLFTEGAEIKEGAVLYQIDPAMYEAAYASAAAALARSEALLDSVRAKADRQAELAKNSYTSQQSLEEARAVLKQTEADIKANQASVTTARINLDRTKLVAPISGRIGRSSLTQGALVTANQTIALATIHQLDPIYVDVTQSSADLLRLRREMKVGQIKIGDTVAARLILSDGTPYEHEGTLQFADVSVSETTGSVILRAIFPNPDRLLMPGMYVRAVLEAGIRENALLVPQRAVTRDPRGKATALFVNGDSKIEQRIIEVNRTIGDAWLVDKGAKEGDRIVVDGLQKVRVGQVVKAVDMPTAQSTSQDDPGSKSGAPATVTANDTRG